MYNVFKHGTDVWFGDDEGVPKKKKKEKKTTKTETETDTLSKELHDEDMTPSERLAFTHASKNPGIFGRFSRNKNSNDNTCNSIDSKMHDDDDDDDENDRCILHPHPRYYDFSRLNTVERDRSVTARRHNRIRRGKRRAAELVVEQEFEKEREAVRQARERQARIEREQERERGWEQAGQETASSSDCG